MFISRERLERDAALRLEDQERERGFVQGLRLHVPQPQGEAALDEALCQGEEDCC